MAFAHSRRRLIAAAAALALLSGGAQAAPPVPAPKPEAADAMDAAQPIQIDMKAYKAWLHAFRTKALKAGIKGRIFEAALGTVKPNIDILTRDQTQPEIAQAVWTYLDNAASAKRIAAGRAQYAANQAVLDKIAKEYGVDAGTLVSIWGLESNYGTIVGKFNAFEGLATLAYEGRRRSFAEGELIAALKIVQRGDESADRMIGSWAGALGQTQFLPSTYLAYAVDEDGDGRRDLFDSVPDVLASIANFLAKSGWTSGEGWGEEVKLPQGFDYALADPAVRLPLARWRELGIVDAKGALLPESANQAALFLPAGAKGPAFSTLDNFRVFLRYNNSMPYALAVGILADAIGGAPPLALDWPREERPLTLSERIELQRLLDQLGYQAGTPDGILGAGTRTALRAYQLKAGLPADGFATAELLDRLRRDAAVAPPAPDANAKAH